MHPEKWQTTIGNIKDNFEVEEHDNYHLDEEGGKDIEYIIFRGPLGRMKLEYVTKPVILDKKTTYSRRIGSETAVEYVYSEDEKTNKLVAYRWDEARDEWEEMDAKNFE